MPSCFLLYLTFVWFERKFVNVFNLPVGKTYEVVSDPIIEWKTYWFEHICTQLVTDCEYLHIIWASYLENQLCLILKPLAKLQHHSVSCLTPTKRHSTSSNFVIKHTRPIYSQLALLDFGDFRASRATINHEALYGILLVVVFEFLMKIILKEVFFDCCKSPSCFSIEKKSRVLNVLRYWKASSRINASAMVVPKAWHFQLWPCQSLVPFLFQLLLSLFIIYYHY